jgi:hypothetical protein
MGHDSSPARRCHSSPIVTNFVEKLSAFFATRQYIYVEGTLRGALQDYAIDIASILGTNHAYAGFTAATGALSQNHDLVSWTFADSENS